MARVSAEMQSPKFSPHKFTSLELRTRCMRPQKSRGKPHEKTCSKSRASGRECGASNELVQGGGGKAELGNKSSLQN